VVEAASVTVAAPLLVGRKGGVAVSEAPVVVAGTTAADELPPTHAPSEHTSSALQHEVPQTLWPTVESHCAVLLLGDGVT
jgi:hypothetical protein